MIRTEWLIVLYYVNCLKNNPKTTQTMVTPTKASNCSKTTDYNKDGVVNSLDYIKCLQDNK